jgi:hypothetical protein
MITLPKDAQVVALEDFLRAVSQSPSQDIRLPIHISRGGGFGFAATCLQTIATWARLHEGAKSIHLAPNFAADLASRDRFASTLQGMGALYFCDAIKAGDAQIRRIDGLKAVVPRVQAMMNMEFRDTLRGRASALCCFEGAKSEFLPALYAKPARGSQHDTTIRSNADLRRIVAELLEACAPGASSKLTDVQTEVLGNLVHQLFKNADVHTATDAEGTLSSIGMRGVQVRHINVDSEEALQEFVLDDISLRTYLGKLSMFSGSEQRARALQGDQTRSLRGAQFIEITVFDTGPGLALRWLADTKGVSSYADISVDEELEAVHSCFKLHSTTHTSDMRGDGLEIAMLAMKQLRAYMFLRTGRLALVQDFSTGDHKGLAVKHRYGTRRKLAGVVGASYSICFPLPL